MSENVQGWELARTEAMGGTGNWRAFTLDMDTMYRAAEAWKQEVGNAEKLWLCWNINEHWCYLQQQLASELGWTPVVGWDPNCGVGKPDKLVPEAIAIDFNAILKLPALFMHVPMEFAFLWSKKLAFWHSDFILNRQQMREVSEKFIALKDGEMSAVFSYGGLKNILHFRKHRYFELLGCTTQGASKSQFEHGCGWWRNIANHINAPTDTSEVARRKKYYGEHGVGIRYWENKYNGKVYSMSEKEYLNNHFSINTVKDYKKGKSKSEEMDINFDINKIAQNLHIDDLLHPSTREIK